MALILTVAAPLRRLMGAAVVEGAITDPPAAPTHIRPTITAAEGVRPILADFL